MKFSGSLARNARFEVPTCLVSIPWLSCSVTASVGEAAKPVIFEGVQTGSMSFCVAGMARRDILTCLHMVSKVVLCDRRNTFASFQKMPSIFVACAALWTRPCSCCMASAALQTCRVACSGDLQCQGYVKWRQHANRAASVGHRENVILHGKGSMQIC